MKIITRYRYFLPPLINNIAHGKTTIFKRFSQSSQASNNINVLNCSDSVKKSQTTMRLTSPQFESVITEGVKTLQELFKSNGYEIRIAGGAVRDLVVGIIPQDLDFATTATPEQMKNLFAKNNIRLINTKGEYHGTITPRINDTNFEITTLRIDKVTDGRHAIVEYTTDWYLDAGRRDLTVNSMFLDFDGTLYDYFNGYEDLLNNRIAFVGNASDRIKEDYLRILRYFRFYGKLAKSPDNHEDDVISAIKENKDGLAKISGERIWSELSRIISGNFGIEMLTKIITLGIGPYIGFPDKCNLKELNDLAERIKSNNYVLEPITVLSSLLESCEDLEKVTARLKFSNAVRDLGFFIITNRNCELDSIRSIARIIFLHAQPRKAEGFMKELLRYRGDSDMLQKYEEWDIPRFPVGGHKIIELGIIDRNRMGFILKKLSMIWIDSDFKISTEDLLALVPGIYEEYVPVKKNKDMKKKMKF